MLKVNAALTTYLLKQIVTIIIMFYYILTDFYNYECSNINNNYFKAISVETDFQII